MQPHTIFRADRVAVSLNGKKGEERGCEAWCRRERLSSMVPAEIRDLETRLAPRCPRWEAMVMVGLSEIRSWSDSYFLSVSAQPAVFLLLSSAWIKADLARSQHSYIRSSGLTLSAIPAININP